MVQYNKNIINNNTIKKVKNNLYGGNYILNKFFNTKSPISRDC